jgi:hypothetical protein
MTQHKKRLWISCSSSHNSETKHSHSCNIYLYKHKIFICNKYIINSHVYFTIHTTFQYVNSMFVDLGISTISVICLLSSFKLYVYYIIKYTWTYKMRVNEKINLFYHFIQTICIVESRSNIANAQLYKCRETSNSHRVFFQAHVDT